MIHVSRRSFHRTVTTGGPTTNYGDSLAEAMAGVELEIRRAYDWFEEQPRDGSEPSAIAKKT